MEKEKIIAKNKEHLQELIQKEILQSLKNKS